jgi:hypothetical protein
VTFGDWVISLAKMEELATLDTGKGKLDGPWYLVWLDARNTGPVADMLGRRFDWSLEGTAASADQLDNPSTDVTDPAVRKLGREVLDTVVRPDEITHPLLVFKAPSDLHPRSVRIVDNDAAGKSVLLLDLSSWTPPTPTPAPTATPIPRPGIGSTLFVGDWQVSLAKMESRNTLVYDSYFNRSYGASGKFWLLWIDARNLGATSNSVQYGLDFTLLDDHGSYYSELYQGATAADKDNIGLAVRLLDRTPLYANITPRGLTHSLLLFDVSADALPTSLALRPHDGDQNSWQFFDLSKKR